MALGRTVSEMKASMTHIEYQSWQRYYDVEPFGFPRVETRYAQALALLSALLRGKSEYCNPHHWRYRRIVEQSSKTLLQQFKAMWGKA